MFNTAFLDLPPLASASGTVQLPGSKSISNRVLLLAALSEGATDIHDLLASDDTRVMLEALQTLGCRVEHVSASHVRIGGLAGQLRTREAQLFLGNAGTAMRPLCAALTLLATTQGGSFELSGVPRMHERPIGDLVDALRGLGGVVTDLGNPGYPPLRLGDGQPHTLHLARPIQVRGDVSSQFLTALLLALPLVAQQEVVIEVVGELISKPYIDITLKLLAQFGVVVQRDGWQRFTVPAGARYQSPSKLHVEADASSASYFVALGAIAPSDQGVTLQGVGLESIQGDIRFVEAAQAMGAVVTGQANALHIQRGAWPLKCIDLDCNHIPDAAMTLAVMALYATGTTTLRNIASWRVKETDRLHAMATELRKLGATIDEGADYIRITPPAANAWTTAPIDTYDDHRMAMCLSLAAFNPAQLAIRINEPHCVAKTFPDYFEALFALTQPVAGRVPVICIDGPTASGKGTLSQRVAKALGYAWLDSGALYRLVGVAAHKAGLSTSTADVAEPAHAEALGALARNMQVHFEGEGVYLNGVDVSAAIRTEDAGMAASRVSALQPVREALKALQHDFARAPGLVADGRDMGTVIFPNAPLKVFLTATAQQRAQRRYKQLISKGNSANIDSLLADLQERDARDMNREHAPLKPAQDAKLLDNTNLSIEQSVQLVLDWWQVCSPRP